MNRARGERNVAPYLKEVIELSKSFAQIARHPTRLGIILALAMLALVVGVLNASATPPSNFMETAPAPALAGTPDGNVRDNNDSTNPPFDWGNSGDGTPTNTCPTATTGFTNVNLSGGGGLFNCGQFKNSTTTPIAPIPTANGMIGTNNIAATAFIVDPLATDVGNKAPDGTACGGSGDPTVYTGAGGEKNGDPLIGKGVETFSYSGVPGKDELTNVYAVDRKPSVGNTTPNEVFFGGDRVINNGESHIDFEFLQSAVNLIVTSPCSSSNEGHFDGHRKQGDFVASIEYTNGGAIGGFELNQWHCLADTHSADSGSGWVSSGIQSAQGTTCDLKNCPASGCSGAIELPAGDPHYQLMACVALPGSTPCPPINNSALPGGGAGFTDAVRAVTNSGGTVPCGGWVCRDGSGNSVANIDTNELMEGSVNLASIGFTGCISTFIPHTRTSASFTSTVKDFALIPFNTCPKPTSIVTETHNDDVHTAVTAVAAGSTVHDKATVTPTGSFTPTGTVTFTFFTNGTCTGTGTASGTITLDGSGVADPSSSQGPLTVGSYSFKAHYNGDSNNEPSDSACEPLQVVDAKIAVSPLTATNEVNAAHTITATVQQDDGLAAGAPGDGTTGFGPAPNGTCVVFTLLNNTAGAAFTTPDDGNSCGGTASNLDDCQTSGGTGTCTIRINTTTAGSVDIHATTTFSVAGVSLTRATGTGGNNSADANKVYVDAQIDLSPLTDTNAVNDPHTITCTIQQDDGRTAGAPGDAVTGFGPAPNGTTCTLSLLNNSAGAAFVGGLNTCTTTSGSCTVQINTSTPGSVDIHATTTFNVGGVSLTRATGTGGLNSADANKVYVDAKIAVSPLTATNAVNSAHTITATVQQDDGLTAGQGGDFITGFAPAPNGTCVVFTLLNNTASAAFANPDDGNNCGGTGSNLDDCLTTLNTGKCSITINTTTAGSVDIHATTTFSVGGVSLTRATGTGGNNSADANKVYVDAQIDLSPLTDTDPINDVHEITATVQQDDGLPAGAPGDATTGFGPAPDGTCVVFTLLNNTAGAVFTGPDDGNNCGGTASNLDDCVTSGGTGTCKIHITSSTAGAVDIHATTTFSVGGVSLTRATGTGGNNSADANKIFQDSAIVILKRSTKTGVGGIPLPVKQPGALFSVDGPDLDTDPDFTVKDNNTPLPAGSKTDADATIGVVCVGGLTPGTYTITETAPPTGYAIGPVVDNTAAAVAGTNCTTTPPGLSDSAIFKDPPLFDIEVNFRDGGSGETSATIVCDDDNNPVTPFVPTETTPATGWDTSSRYLGQPAPKNIVCTLTVDP